MSRHFWLASEKSLVTRMYEGGAPLRDIAAATGVTNDAIRRAVGRWKLHRPEEHIGIETRQNLAWPRVITALEQQPMTVAQLCDALGMFRSVVLRAIDQHRAQLHIARYITTTRKPAAVWASGPGADVMKPVKVRRARNLAANPFLVAAGAVTLPQRGARGRIHRMESEAADLECT